ncbi:MAG: YsnF/AvaK domain-containing protein [Williamsia sp.]|nr:YsnF/AvaK domain-containing protein [Williamsia sp.]
MDQPLVIPVVEERLKVEKKVVEAGKVKISKKVKEEEKTVDIPVSQEEVQVERIPVNRFVETAPQIRYEGETMIVPVLREVVVVEKRIELIEEIHITKKIHQTQVSQQVTLRTEEVTVERLPGENNLSVPGS